MSSLNWLLYPNFGPEEFLCRCGCGRSDMQPDFMAKLQDLRNKVGPLEVTSGFRCSNHPIERKKKRAGAHSVGSAADVRALITGRHNLLKVAFMLDFMGVGVAKSFIHLDEGHPYASRPAAWSY